MSSDPLVNLNIASNQTEPGWIDQIQKAVPEAFSPRNTNNRHEQPPALIVVQIPDLSENEPPAKTEVFSRSEKIAATFESVQVGTKRKAERLDGRNV